jgi:hypothetical protein
MSQNSRDDTIIPFNPSGDHDVEHFANTYNLYHHLDVFQKASRLIHGNGTTEDVVLSPTEETAIEQESTRKWRQPRMLYFTILVCSLGAVEQGTAQSGMNGANIGFPRAFGIDSDSKHDTFVVGLINSGIYLSAGLL